MPIASAHRQPLCPSAATKVPTTAARIQPSAQNASSHTITRPRIRAGANSLIRVEATGSSAPRRSEERRVGKECRSQCAPYYQEKIQYKEESVRKRGHERKKL